MAASVEHELRSFIRCSNYRRVSQYEKQKSSPRGFHSPTPQSITASPSPLQSLQPEAWHDLATPVTAPSSGRSRQRAAVGATKAGFAKEQGIQTDAANLVNSGLWRLNT